MFSIARVASVSFLFAACVSAASLQWQCPGGPPRGGGNTGPPRSGGGSNGGPGDTVRRGSPPTRDAGPPTSDPTGPTTPDDPAPTGPSTGPGPTTPGTGPGPTAPTRGPSTGGGRGVPLAADFDAWHVWWEFNKDRFLELRRSLEEVAASTGEDDIAIGRGTRAPVRSTGPTPREVHERIVPVLRRLVHDTNTGRSLVASSLLSLARIGGVDGMRDAIRHVLKHGDAERREIATLAYGIDGRSEFLDDLFAIARDDDGGRALTGAIGGVSYRLRAFALYATGLAAERGESRVKRRVFFAVREIFERERSANQDVRIAALSALRVLSPDARTTDGRSLRDDALYWVLNRLQRDRLEPILASQALCAASALAGRADPSTRVARHAAEILRDKDAPNLLRQAACLALGNVCNREDEASLAVLTHQALDATEPQTRSFAMLALGEIGGADNIVFLRKALRSPKSRKNSKPWIALAVALAATDAPEAVRVSIRQDLAMTYDEVRAPEFSSGIAIALGMLRATEFEEKLSDRMLEIRAQSRDAGYHALALGLMRSRNKVAAVRSLFAVSGTREDALVQSATSLALLGDKSISSWLIERLRKDDTSITARHGLTKALGLVGDKHAIDGLLQIVEDEKAMVLPRAFAAVALGMIGDEDVAPWNAPLAAGVHYRASVGTLTGEVGVLDIL
ncbi:MAG: HEAT repeat domain-containing protein [Planctomycetes bacterium]|nr:HEAT repeat domain-containing protein [Planctomycetota bacterium]